MTDLSITTALDTPAAAPLSPEQFAERRREIAAAVQMFSEIARLQCESENVPNADEREHDAAHAKMTAASNETVLSYLRAFVAQSEHAQRGFAYMLSDFLFSDAEGCVQTFGEYEEAVHHANPPLTPMAILRCNPGCTELEPTQHNGIELKPAERKRLARSWFKPARQPKAASH